MICRSDMTPFELRSALNSAVLLVDTREQDTEALRKRIELTGMDHERFKLYSGDYSIKCTVGSSNYSLADKVAIERKMSLDELAACFGRERERFVREFDRAKAIDMRLYLLVENATYENLYAHKYRSRLSPAAYAASIFAWQARYDCRVIFCKAENSGKIIHDILYRELKERLESGEYM